MKFRTMLASAAGVGIGYVLGAAAGRERFEQIKTQAQRIVSDPDVRQKVADLPNQVKENLPKAQSVVTDKLKGAQNKAQGSGSAETSSTFDSPASFDSPSTFDTPATFGTSSDAAFDGPTTFGTETTDDPIYETPTTGNPTDDRI